MTWRKDSGLNDGKDAGVDLVGGYYDAGDNLKFGFPMAFTTTMLSWSIIEFGDAMGDQLQHALDAVRWATDYFLKATNDPNKIYIGVGEPLADHNCWERPEDMDTPRISYFIDAGKPGSEVAAETAAALASASMAFKKSDPQYSGLLLERAMQVFEFADTHRGSYGDSLGGAVCPFYCDFSGYQDDLLWGAAWIYRANNFDKKYWDYIVNNINWFVSSNQAEVGDFGWDDKHGGFYTLLYKELSSSNDPRLAPFRKTAEDFACTTLPESPTKTVAYSPGGLMFKPQGSNMQNPASRSFLLLALSRQLQHDISCNGSANVHPSRLIEVAKSQVDYILGKNPLSMSYM